MWLDSLNFIEKKLYDVASWLTLRDSWWPKAAFVLIIPDLHSSNEWLLWGSCSTLASLSQCFQNLPPTPNSLIFSAFCIQFLTRDRPWNFTSCPQNQLLDLSGKAKEWCQVRSLATHSHLKRDELRPKNGCHKKRPLLRPTMNYRKAARFELYPVCFSYFLAIRSSTKEADWTNPHRYVLYKTTRCGIIFS